MRAVVYHGPREIAVEQVPDARIERPSDVLVRITSTSVCGSDLHMYEGRIPVEDGRVLGHENLGEVVEIGSAVDRIRVGDRVCLPFNISCGLCRNCERGYPAYCLTTNPGQAGAAYGYPGMGPYHGGQAELLRVPYGDVNCLRLPPDSVEKENDYVLLADAWPAGYHATELAGVQAGDSVAVYGAGPVGLLAAYSALLVGASTVFVVDQCSDRLRLAEQIGAVPVDNRDGDPVGQIMEHTRGQGVDAGCECVGWQAHDSQGHETPAATMNNLVRSVRETGSIGVVGVFAVADSRSPDLLMRKGELAFDIGLFFQKGLRIASGLANVKAYNRRLRDLITVGRARPSFVVSHNLDLDDAPDAYRHLDQRDEGWTKVVLRP